jgi:hypothetical protein
MRTFRCHCGNLIFFESSQCQHCGAQLGYLPQQAELMPISRQDNVFWLANGMRYKQCRNYSEEEVCNWMIDGDDTHDYCLACRLNQTIPDLTRLNNRFYWYRLEQAKRRLLYSLLAMQLPLVGREEDPERGLAFAFLEDAPVFRESGSVVTGHAAGLITINLAEADDVARERMRNDMNEPYRTLLGHFRHESAHYYWERLIHGTEWLEPFRAMFGDERRDYDQAMADYYSNGEPPDWEQSYISAYAVSHPWEDWAETWAHYLHLVDTLETAHDFGLVGKLNIDEPASGRRYDPYGSEVEFDLLIQDWQRLTVAMNSISRSMGQHDVYPFVIREKTRAKLEFVHRLVRGISR